jgi:hypothetical protein
MRGTTTRQATMLSTLTSDSLIPLDHPIRRIKPVVEAELAELAPEFDAMYARTGRQSVPPEHLLKATVLMALYSIRSERQFCERLRHDLLFKFFLDLNVDDEGFDRSDSYSAGSGRGGKEKEIPGNDLLSRPVARAVPSALTGLTAVFGMGTGVTPSLWSPDISLCKRR